MSAGYELEIQGPGLSTKVPLREGALSIGWGEGNGLRLPRAPEVGERSCVVEDRAGSLVVRGLDARAPLLVNGARAFYQKLSAGDEVAVGPFRLVVRPRAEAAARPWHEGLSRGASAEAPDPREALPTSSDPEEAATLADYARHAPPDAAIPLEGYSDEAPPGPAPPPREEPAPARSARSSSSSLSWFTDGAPPREAPPRESATRGPGPRPLLREVERTPEPRRRTPEPEPAFEARRRPPEPEPAFEARRRPPEPELPVDPRRRAPDPEPPLEPRRRAPDPEPALEARRRPAAGPAPAPAPARPRPPGPPPSGPAAPRPAKPGSSGSRAAPPRRPAPPAPVAPEPAYDPRFAPPPEPAPAFEPAPRFAPAPRSAPPPPVAPEPAYDPRFAPPPEPAPAFEPPPRFAPPPEAFEPPPRSAPPPEPAPRAAPRATSRDADLIHELLSAARAHEASDLHLSPNLPPVVRVNGQLTRATEEPLDPALLERIARSVTTDEQFVRLERTGDLDFCYVLGEHRYRANLCRHRSGVAATFRVVAERIPTLEELGIPAAARKLTQFAQGLVLVTGPLGAGKTTTMMSLVHEVNATRPDHLITVEDPIEFMIPPVKCQVSQRELGVHTKSFESALRAALREDPDVIVIGDLRDYSTARLAISAAETGHLVFASMPTMNAMKSLDKLVDMFPAAEQATVRTVVSESLRGILSQRLVPGLGGRRVAAVELLLNSIGIGNMIREGKTASLRNAMQTGRASGMRTLEMSLEELVARGLISDDAAVAALQV